MLDLNRRDIIQGAAAIAAFAALSLVPGPGTVSAPQPYRLRQRG